MRSMRVRRANSTRSSTVPSFESGDDFRRAIVGAIVENAANAHVGVLLRGERAQHLFAGFTAPHDDGAAFERAGRRHAADEHRQNRSLAGERHKADRIPGEKPDAREDEVVLEEEDAGERHEQREGPARHDANAVQQRRAVGGDGVEVEELEADLRDQRDRGMATAYSKDRGAAT